MKRINTVWFIRNDEDKNRYYYELDKNEEVRFVYKNHAFSRFFMSKVFRLSFSVKVNNWLKLPWKSFLLEMIYKTIRFEKNKPLVFVFNQGWYDKTIIKWLKKKHSEIITILYCDDTIECFAKEISDLRPEKLGDEFDYVLCYNIGDVKKYGYTLVNACISKHENLNDEQFEPSDLSFIGQAKDRDVLLQSISEYLDGKCEMDFLLIGSSSNGNENIKVTDRYLTYKEYLSRECAANCILELVKGDTEGATLRCWEAVYYNKKLLTNWKGIFEFPFYNPNHIQYFEKPEEIDIKFLTEKIPVEYNYQGQNSPELFLKNIADLITNSDPA